jgi:hypothetical protein
MQVKDIDPFVATGIVAMGVVEGAKTAPPPLGSEVSPSEKTEKRKRTITGLYWESVTQPSGKHWNLAEHTLT